MDSATEISTPAPKRVLYNLEAMRGVCALVVAIFHCRWASDVQVNPIIQNAYLFVDFFFVLSGFILSYTYFDSANAFDLRAFLTKRFFRLYPLHAVTLAAFLALLLGKQALGPSFGLMTHGELPGNFAVMAAGQILLLHGVVPGLGGILNVPSWSIASEFWTYVLFGLCCAFTTKANRRVAALGLIGLLAAILVLIWAGPGGLWTAPRMPRCVASFGLGVLVWAATRWRPLKLRGPQADVAQLMLMALLYAFLSSVSMATRSNLAAPFLFAVVIFVAAQDQGSFIRRVLEARLLRALGTWS